MIDKKKIIDLVENQSVVEDLFIVDISVNTGNVITVLIDSPKGINIKHCTSISRLIENSLDRNVEDFGLQVSSPGLDQPFKVIEQYHKNIGREIKVVKTNGEKQKGKLLKVEDEGIEIESVEKVKVEGKKKKQEIKKQTNINFKEIKTTKIVITF